MKTVRNSYITYQEAQKLYRVGRTKLQHLVKIGVITAYRPGKETMLDLVSVEEWIRSTQIIPKKRMGRPRKGAARNP